MDFDYRFAVATFERPSIFSKNTLSLFLINGIDLNKVDVFIENEEQLKKYKPLCGDLNYIITNTKGLGEKRNWIRYYYTYINYCKYVVQIDDDIEYFITKTERPYDNLKKICDEGFEACEKENASIWTICPSDNNWFYKDYYTIDLKYCCGCFNGWINEKNYCPYMTDMEHFEDIDWTLFHFFKDGKIIKNFKYGLKTKYLNPEGGMASQFNGNKERMKYAEEQADYLMDKWGRHLFKIKRNKHGINLLLNRHYKPTDDELFFRKSHKSNPQINTLFQ